MGVVLLILGFGLILGAGVYAFLRLRALAKEGEHSFSSADIRKFFVLTGVAGVGGALANSGIAVANSWNPEPIHWVMLLAGGLLFFASVFVFLVTFYVRYWRTDLIEGLKKHNRLWMRLAVAAMVVSFLLAGEGMAPYFSYPLTSGFAIGSDGFVWLYPDQSTPAGLKIQWYGVLIVLGAVLAYKISDHNFYKRYGRHGILDSVFFLAFPAGIISARIWYVVGNWNGDGQGGVNFAEEVAKGNWWRIFAIWEGGLTILGGAVGGILAGALFFYFRRRYSDLRYAFDMVIPTILLAQAIGRFGNFFNHEVYGKVSDMSAWPLIPTWVRYNMATSWSSGAAVSSQMFAPLFLIEALFNVLGFFVIVYAVPKIWRKHRALGVNLGLYLIWYGIVRIIMEPMRDQTFNMGTDGSWSIWNAMIYIILGAATIAFMQVFAYIRAKKGLPIEMGTQPEQLADAKTEAAPKMVKKNDLSKPKAIPHPTSDEPKEDE